MKNKKLFFSAVLCFLCAASVNLNAQIKVASTGKVSVAISDTVTPLSSLSVGSAGFANAGLGIQMTSTTVGSNSGWNNIYSKLLVTQLSPQWNTSISGATQSNGAGDRLVGVHGSGMKSSNSSNGRSYGVLGIAGRATSGYNYGICGFIQNGGGNGAAVYGTVNSYGEGEVPGRYAGYFDGQTKVNGNLYATNCYTSSDARLKTNITAIKSETLQKIHSLQPVQFTWQQVEDKHTADTATVKRLYFSEDMDYKRSHYGFIAQDIQKLFPELVQEDGDGYLSVNYTELIPLMLQSLQELSAEVAELKKKVNELAPIQK